MASKWVWTKFLGQGSYGSVFRAECASPSLDCTYYLPKTVAIKSAPESCSWSLHMEKAILDDLRGCLHIVRCLSNEDFKSTNAVGKKFYNLVLEYADQGSLEQLIKSKGGWIHETEASWYASMLLRGLSCVHGQGYVHCDMKPANVLVFNIPSNECKGVLKYNLKIADFGLAKKGGGISAGAGKEYKYRGTLLYSSPESVVFGEHEAAMDIWSLGCIVLEMLLGEGGLWKNYLHVDAQCLAEMIANYEDDRLKCLLPELDNLSVLAKDFVKRCLTKRVEERWTAEELVTHPFITHNKGLLKKFEAQLSSQRRMQFQANTPYYSLFGPSQISLGVY
ncbi:mitogen-activated protein kinase kinase kinase 20-like [Apium graveolens]|uniref:mitogen-activated protein kinase kinase kinase 20-like n=1 Tax=Apium graveolens TaxID=4045 RepID=UPI003D7B4D91